MIALLVIWDRPVHALIIAAAVLAQFAAMRVLLRDPKGKAPWYNGTGVTLYVCGHDGRGLRAARSGDVLTLSWLSIVRLGLVQMSLGAIVVLTTSTLNRLMVVELALPAVVPGLLVALHYGIQLSRARAGAIASDLGGRRTRWIVGGMAVLACGGFLARTRRGRVRRTRPVAGLALSFLAYALIGVGVGASGTSLLALLAARHRSRAAARRRRRSPG